MNRIILCIFLVLFATLTSVDQGKSSHINESCIIYSTTAFCESVTGNFLPRELSKDVRMLEIVNSNLNSLTAEDFSYLINLEEVFIYSCYIPLAPEINLFSSLLHVKSLRIINSNVTAEVIHLLRGTTSIYTLSLSRNKLTHISKYLFRDLTRVKFIDVSNNLISKIEIDAFRDLLFLECVNLTNNKIGMKFDSSFLSLTSRCVHCATLPNTMECPNDASNRCEDNADVDALWREFSAKHNLYMGENPVCKSIGSTAVYSQSVLSQSGPINSRAQHLSQSGLINNWPKDDGCQLLFAGNCPEHEEREAFLRRVCAIQSGGDREYIESSSPANSDIDKSNEDNTKSKKHHSDKSSHQTLCSSGMDSCLEDSERENDSGGHLRISYADFLIRILLFSLAIFSLIALYLAFRVLVQCCRKKSEPQELTFSHILFTPIGCLITKRKDDQIPALERPLRRQ